MAIGIDTCRHLKGRPEYLAVASLPLLLGAHQLDETFVWWGLQGHVGATVGHVAMWIYLLFALVVLPVFVPAMMMLIGPLRHRKWRTVPFLLLGTAVAAVLLDAMLSGHPHAKLGNYHLAYSIGLKHGMLVIACYIVATCGPLLASGLRSIVILGVANLVVVVVLARLSADGFTSLWCFYAALLSGAIALYLRYANTTSSARQRVKAPDRSAAR